MAESGNTGMDKFAALLANRVADELLPFMDDVQNLINGIKGGTDMTSLGHLAVECHRQACEVERIFGLRGKGKQAQWALVVAQVNHVLTMLKDPALAGTAGVLVEAKKIIDVASPIIWS